MSSYHSSFTYKDTNSKDLGLVIVAFEPDNGFKDTFLSMDNVSDNYYDGTKRFDYGSKYNASPEIQITVIKKDGSDMTLDEFRKYARWLTGARINSWLDMCIGKINKQYIGDGATQQFKLLDNNGSPLFGLVIVDVDNQRTQDFTYDYKTGMLSLNFIPSVGSIIDVTITPPIYSFLGKFINLEQYKLDSRTIGARATFSSVSPWAYSAPQTFDCRIWQLLGVDDNGVLSKGDDADALGCDESGILSTSSLDSNSYFNVDDNGVAYLDNAYRTVIDNQSDDLYTYIYLDIDYQNENSTFLSIKNATLGEESLITGIDVNESISISAKQFITSDKPQKIFGDSFNFVWPRLAPGANSFVVEGDSCGSAQFTYRYPMKVGDCAMDIA